MTFSGKTKLHLGAAALTLTFYATDATAQDQVELIYSDALTATDIRSKMLVEDFGNCLGDGFRFQPYFASTLFKQGTDIPSMQRGVLDMAAPPIFDFYNQVPATSVLGTPFLFRDYEHMRAVYDSDLLDDLLAQIEADAGVKVLEFIYIGTRELGYVGDRRIMTPEDAKGLKLRMPPGEGWQFMGTAMGATPTPVPLAETYTALQTGAIDGQDNGYPIIHSMKFDEILTHIGLTNHMVMAIEFTIGLKKWNSLTGEQQEKVAGCAENFRKKVEPVVLRQEADLADQMSEKGIDIYEPNLDAFRDRILETYGNSKYSADWPEGLVEKIVSYGN
ncbi:MAG: TRAP transporter substrate-binding protein DctP [Tropicimonas sp.]|uniref:TRAP transporter substrate-binding protein DctP n=1 Tax=Tropicimonas sp. TaxID=2067044 RepID=UPI003A83B458